MDVIETTLNQCDDDCDMDTRTGLLSLETNDALRELAVDVQSFLTRDGVDTDKRVNVLHGFTAYDRTTISPTRELGLLDARVNRLEGAKESDELR